MFEEFLSGASDIGQTKRKLKSVEWEISRSSLSKLKKNPTYDECKKYACEDIIKSLTYEGDDLPFITEISRGQPFNFLVRVGTDFAGNPNDPEIYFKQFENRKFISFSTISNKNVSFYGLGGNVLFAYRIDPTLIAHVFPMDSDSDPYANDESQITELPSLWLTLKELNAVTLKLQTYNQVTCRTKDDHGKIIKPYRIIAIEKTNPEIEQIAKQFNIGCTVVHPNKNAVCETFDPFLPIQKENVRKAVNLINILKKKYGIDVYAKYNL